MRRTGRDGKILIDEKLDRDGELEIEVCNASGNTYINKTDALEIISVLEKAFDIASDTSRIDWLADPKNQIGRVLLPQLVVEKNLEGGLRAAIDEAMKIGETA
jgi:hypothetical protein